MGLMNLIPMEVDIIIIIINITMGMRKNNV